MWRKAWQGIATLFFIGLVIPCLLISISIGGDLPYSFRRFTESALVCVLSGLVFVARWRKTHIDLCGLLLLFPCFFYLAQSALAFGHIGSSDQLLLSLNWLLLMLVAFVDFRFRLEPVRSIAWTIFIILLAAGYASLIFETNIRNITTFYVMGLEGRFGGAWAGFSQVNLYASFLATFIVFLCALSRIRPSADGNGRQVMAVVSWAMLVAGGIVLFSIGSRVGIIGCFLGLICLCLASRRDSLFVFNVATGCVIAFLVSVLLTNYFAEVGVGRDPVSRIVGVVTLDNSIQWRMDAIKLSFLAWLDSPWLGHEVGGWQHAVQEVYLANSETKFGAISLLTAGHPHNYLMWLLVEHGLFGVALVFIPFATWVGVNLRRCRSGCWLPIAVLMPIGLHLMTEFPDQLSGVHLPLFVFMLSWFSRRLGDEQHDVSRPLKRSQSLSLISLHVALSVIFVDLALQVVKLDSARLYLLSKEAFSVPEIIAIADNPISDHWLYGAHFKRSLLLLSMKTLSRHKSTQNFEISFDTHRVLDFKPSLQAWTIAIMYFQAGGATNSFYNPQNFDRLKRKH